jgi:hypothetical protein
MIGGDQKATADLSTPLRCAQDDSRFEIVPELPLANIVNASATSLE